MRNNECKNFRFRKDKTGYIGIEREYFLTALDRKVFLPIAKDFLSKINDPRWTYELSACQVEARIDPLKNIKEVKKSLAKNDNYGQNIANSLNARLSIIEVAEKTMPLAVYPNPRYLKIKKSFNREILSAACRVTATHLHFGMPNLQTAIQTNNLLRRKIKYFCDLGDHSKGKRLELYKAVAEHWNPPHYRNTKHFIEIAKKEGFIKNPRDCWHFIRISKYGTIELRMFGATENLKEICEWIKIVQEIISIP